jgi:hypothetical protein
MCEVIDTGWGALYFQPDTDPEKIQAAEDDLLQLLNEARQLREEWLQDPVSQAEHQRAMMEHNQWAQQRLISQREEMQV